jgi:glutathione S-transferase
VLDEGFVHLRKLFAAHIPAPMLTIVAPLARRSMRQHLFERGIARHTRDEITAMGRADVDAISDWLGDRAWFIGDGPTKVDASALGLLAVTIRSPMATPVATYARTKPNLVAFVDRVLARFFAEGARVPAAA